MPRPSRRRARSRARSSARAPQDGSYKHLFSHPEMVEGLLHDFVQEDWLALIDFSTLEKRGGSYVTDDLRDREDDILVRAGIAAAADAGRASAGTARFNGGRDHAGRTG